MEIVVNCPQFANKSFKILHLNNPLRRLCIRIVLNPYVVIISEYFDFSLNFSWFERITMIVILINCITLGMYKPCADSTTCNRKCLLLKVYLKITIYKILTILTFFKVADNLIYVYFSAEMIIKMVSQKIIYK